MSVISVDNSHSRLCNSQQSPQRAKKNNSINKKLIGHVGGHLELIWILAAVCKKSRSVSRVTRSFTDYGSCRGYDLGMTAGRRPHKQTATHYYGSGQTDLSGMSHCSDVESCDYSILFPVKSNQFQWMGSLLNMIPFSVSFLIIPTMWVEPSPPTGYNSKTDGYRFYYLYILIN